jgi:uncharacterized protein (UPF0332 family)
MKPNEFLTLAIKLSSDGSEAAQRSAVSRGYYGAFHQAMELVESCGIQLPTTAEAHKKILFCLSQSDDVELTVAGRKLGTLREARNQADYDLKSNAFAKKGFASLQLKEVQSVVDIVTEARNRIAVFGPKMSRYATEVLGLLSKTKEGN